MPGKLSVEACMTVKGAGTEYLGDTSMSDHASKKISNYLLLSEMHSENTLSCLLVSVRLLPHTGSNARAKKANGRVL